MLQIKILGDRGSNLFLDFRKKFILNILFLHQIELLKVPKSSKITKIKIPKSRGLMNEIQILKNS